MVILKDTIEINTSFDKFVNWFENIDKEFIKWSPYHTDFIMCDGNLDKDSKVIFKEVVEGITYDIQGTIIQRDIFEDKFKFVFLTKAKLGRIIFIGEKIDNETCKFTHIEEMGLKTRVVGTLVNFMLFQVLFKKKCKWDLIKEDMRIDNIYLKDILEKDKYPARLT